MGYAGIRSVEGVVQTFRGREGAGFEIRRPFPTPRFEFLDPFILLDEMGPTDNRPGEAKGAPDHPHRGFETVTYLLSGEMDHRDSRGGGGRLVPGDAQWMTAGAGIVHSELPTPRILREGGRMHGFQLWVNLPAAEKMARPRYQDLRAAAIPAAATPDGKGRVSVISGQALGAAAATRTHTPILYLHASLDPAGQLELPVPHGWNAAVYVFRGRVEVGAGKVAQAAASGELALLAHDGDVARVEAEPGGAELLFLAGEPIREPVVHYGPFVMSTEQEIMDAIADYRAGRMGEIPPEISAPG
jgi:redox-sensitive bicupin YhaK (pirin superfamily)